MLKVYNTMTRKKEDFHPIEKGKVSIYCCGVTPYDEPHIGNARPFVVWDAIRRYFTKKGYYVRYIQNFTDVDDKIIATAKREGVLWNDISNRYIDAYFKSMDALNIHHADLYPRVSENMDDIIKMVQTLVDKGYAYVLEGGDVFYDVTKDEQYGKLSGRKLDDNEAGARIEIDGRKHHPMDFALWKSAKEGEPSWPSPWGEGRPGWHIECSAMSLKYLGEKFDFHGGGADLIFPHHENEIAQSQAAIGDDHSFAQYWLHNGFITVSKSSSGEAAGAKEAKMSKSAGNFFTVKDILNNYPGEVIRFFLLGTHYRSPLEFGEERIKEAQTAYNRLATSKDYLFDLIRKIDSGDTNSEGRSSTAITVSKAGGLAEMAERLLALFYDAMEDDFNTSLAISHMFELSKEINIFYNELINSGILSVGGINEIDAKIIYRVRDVYMEMAGIIGIFEKAVKAVDDHAEFKLIDDLMEIIIANRQAAREAKNWKIADDIRDKLKLAGIILEDTPQGVRWKRANNPR